MFSCGNWFKLVAQWYWRSKTQPLLNYNGRERAGGELTDYVNQSYGVSFWNNVEDKMVCVRGGIVHPLVRLRTHALCTQ